MSPVLGLQVLQCVQLHLTHWNAGDLNVAPLNVSMNSESECFLSLTSARLAISRIFKYKIYDVYFSEVLREDCPDVLCQDDSKRLPGQRCREGPAQLVTHYHDVTICILLIHVTSVIAEAKFY